MTFTDKHIIDTYSALFEGLTPMSKIELIERLSKSLKTEGDKREKKFFKSFGSFASDKSAEDIISDIRSSRTFRKKDISF